MPDDETVGQVRDRLDQGYPVHVIVDELTDEYGFNDAVAERIVSDAQQDAGPGWTQYRRPLAAVGGLLLLAAAAFAVMQVVDPGGEPAPDEQAAPDPVPLETFSGITGAYRMTYTVGSGNDSGTLTVYRAQDWQRKTLQLDGTVEQYWHQPSGTVIHCGDRIRAENTTERCAFQHPSSVTFALLPTSPAAWLDDNDRITANHTGPDTVNGRPCESYTVHFDAADRANSTPGTALPDMNDSSMAATVCIDTGREYIARLELTLRPPAVAGMPTTLTATAAPQSLPANSINIVLPPDNFIMDAACERGRITLQLFSLTPQTVQISINDANRTVDLARLNRTTITVPDETRVDGTNVFTAEFGNHVERETCTWANTTA